LVKLAFSTTVADLSFMLKNQPFAAGVDVNVYFQAPLTCSLELATV